MTAVAAAHLADGQIIVTARCRVRLRRWIRRWLRRLQGAIGGAHLRRFGIPTNGISGIANDNDDVRAHAKDERIAATALDESRVVHAGLVKELGDRGELRVTPTPRGRGAAARVHRPHF